MTLHHWLPVENSMGQEIDQTRFEQEDFEAFHRRLGRETRLLGELIEKKAFSRRPPVAGFEIEAWLLHRDLTPAPLNREYLERLNNPLASAELAKFNVELNNTPTPLAGKAFSRLDRDLGAIWKCASAAAEAMDTYLVMIGILPTVEQSLLNMDNMSELNRYRALNEQILRQRGKPIHLDIQGRQHLKLDHHNVMLESAATSFQIHMQVPLEAAHHYYNASLIASAPVVAVSANSPYLFGLDLWDETRIPLFEQAVETGGFNGAAHGPLRRVSFGSDYARKSIFECFKENLDHFPVILPIRFDTPAEQFQHLRLHNGTIWRWNRPLIGFDDDGTPHIRIEHRTPPAGPSIADSIANAAFYYGLTQNLCEQMQHSGALIPFAQAKDNFYLAARHGLNAHITWRDGEKFRLSSLLVSDLLPRAVLGLKSLHIAPGDINDYLDIIRQRIDSGQNGCAWQRAFPGNGASRMKAMTRAYIENQRRGDPVGEWTIC